MLFRSEAKQRQAAEAKQELIDAGLREVWWCARKMLSDPEFEYPRGLTTLIIEARCREEVRKILEKELRGDETTEAVKELVRGAIAALISSKSQYKVNSSARVCLQFGYGQQKFNGKSTVWL